MGENRIALAIFAHDGGPPAARQHMSNRYEIRDQIGKGGLGAVYKAFDTQLQREVAIKRVLSPDQATEEEVKEAARKLIEEAQTLSCLNHPNIVTVFDVGQDEQGGFVVMELLRGETLDETISRGVLTREDFVEVVYQTMEALIAAQASDVIHRDIKPTNIMVIWQASGKFQLKILDFGLAKFSKTPSVQTMDQEESVLGSIFFMAPEQFERGELDARTDLYQMGCVYYNALTGQYPFNGDTAPQVMNAHLQHKVIPLDQIRPDLPPAICQWVMWLINRDIDHRPVDARDALGRWPKNPDPAGDIPVAKALPVEDTPQVASGQIRIVTAASQASAPPSLIVPGTGSASATGSRTGRLHTGGVKGKGRVAGGRTGRLSGGSRTGPLVSGGGRSGGSRGQASRGGGNKAKLIVFGAVAVLVLMLVGVRVVGSSAHKKREARIVALSSSETTGGTVNDAVDAIALLEDRRTSQSVRGDADRVLQRLEASGVDDAILRAFSASDSLSLKLRLAPILAERGHRPAVVPIMAAFREAANDEQKVAFLNAVQLIAEMPQIAEMLDALSGSQSLTVRRVFEDTVLAVLRKSDDPSSVVNRILDRLSDASGAERRSLFRILGSIGGEAVLERVRSIYDGAGDIELQRDAMTAYLNWRDRSVLGEVEEILTSTQDSPLRGAAERAYVRLVTLPSSAPVEEVLATWDRAFELASNPNDVRRLVGAAVEFPSPESLALVRQWAQHETHGPLARGVVASLERAIAGVRAVSPGEDLKGNRARIQGESRASINSFLESLTSWTSPETWFTWVFKASEAGEYRIEVDQADVNEDPSEFEVYLNGEVFPGLSRTTEDFETFETVSLEGTVVLEADTIYALTLKAGGRVQPRMMDIGAVRLAKP